MGEGNYKKKGAFSVDFSFRGGKWLGKLLCQLSLGLTEAGLSFKHIEHSGFIVGTVKENGRGSFLQLTVFKRNARRRFSTVRIPAGSNFKGWGSLGADLRSFFDQKVALKEDVGKRNHGQDRVRTQDDHWRAAHPAASSGEKDIHVNYTGQFNLASWWSPVVICKSSCSEPN
ncbi:hypothetical protein FRX31_014338 [Thalictrum thalictroides]|uniref:Uncharacterized protein n=1 Tax=Thalictrum thalictroides TaxID=46969 RepID=A0A7J6WF41_THATH|nr:hypothetical protein FRX31_014338 [Thalictrum thalictroides]